METVFVFHVVTITVELASCAHTQITTALLPCCIPNVYCAQVFLHPHFWLTEKNGAEYLANLKVAFGLI